MRNSIIVLLCLLALGSPGARRDARSVLLESTGRQEPPSNDRSGSRPVRPPLPRRAVCVGRVLTGRLRLFRTDALRLRALRHHTAAFHLRTVGRRTPHSPIAASAGRPRLLRHGPCWALAGTWPLCSRASHRASRLRRTSRQLIRSQLQRSGAHTRQPAPRSAMARIGAAVTLA